MPRDAQNTIVQYNNGTGATTSYGPRLVNTDSPSGRPLSWAKRETVFQLDGDANPLIEADFDNDTRFAWNEGDFVTDAYLVTEEGAGSVELVFVDEDLNMSTPVVAVAGTPNQWVAVRDIDQNFGMDSQAQLTVPAGFRGTLIVSYLQAEYGDDGVLRKHTVPV